jgi:toxin-antitoxin system PIN domain toxin
VALLDVNALVALAWDSHVHHGAVRAWFRANSASGWATCPVTEIGFIRVSSNPKVLPSPISPAAAGEVLKRLRAAGAHRFLGNDVSATAPDFPEIAGHRQLTDALLLTVARRHGTRLVTFDGGIAALAGGRDVELLAA